MNIFQEPENFIERSVNQPLPSIKMILTLADEIKSQMGKKAYLLDKYLSTFLDAASEIISSDTVQAGIGAGAELRYLCKLKDYNKESDSFPFVQKFRNFIETHPLDFEETVTKKSLYLCLLSDEYLETALNEFTKNWRHQIFSRFDTIALNDLFDTICSMTGNEKMEQLNHMLYRRFFTVFPADAFVCGFTHNLLYHLTYRDPETKKQIWEFITQV